MLISLIVFVIVTVVAAYFASNNLTMMDVNLFTDGLCCGHRRPPRHYAHAASPYQQQLG